MENTGYQSCLLLMSCCFEILVLSVAQEKIKNKPGIGRYTRDVSCLLCCIVLLCEIATYRLHYFILSIHLRQFPARESIDGDL